MRNMEGNPFNPPTQPKTGGLVDVSKKILGPNGERLARRMGAKNRSKGIAQQPTPDFALTYAEKARDEQYKELLKTVESCLAYTNTTIYFPEKRAEAYVAIADALRQIHIGRNDLIDQAWGEIISGQTSAKNHAEAAVAIANSQIAIGQDPHEAMESAIITVGDAGRVRDARTALMTLEEIAASARPELWTQELRTLLLEEIRNVLDDPGPPARPHSNPELYASSAICKIAIQEPYHREMIVLESKAQYGGKGSLVAYHAYGRVRVTEGSFTLEDIQGILYHLIPAQERRVYIQELIRLGYQKEAFALAGDTKYAHDTSINKEPRRIRSDAELLIDDLISIFEAQKSLNQDVADTLKRLGIAATKLTERDKRYTFYQTQIALCYAQSGKIDQATAAADLVSLDDYSYTLPIACQIYLLAKNFVKAKEVAEWLVKHGPGKPTHADEDMKMKIVAAEIQAAVDKVKESHI